MSALFVSAYTRTIQLAIFALLMGVLMTGPFAGHACLAAVTQCPQGGLDTEDLPPGNGEDLVVTGGGCRVMVAQTYKYGKVNIYDGGTLTFVEVPNKNIDFWASSILIENKGAMIAGSTAAPIGTSGGTLTIHIWGKDQGTASPGGTGVECATGETCGVDQTLWSSNPLTGKNPGSCHKAKDVTGQNLPGGENDCFYAYAPLDYDGADPKAYFGYKVLGLSYGGTLQLYGRKGAYYGVEPPPLPSGTSWARLDAPVKTGATTLYLGRLTPYWAPGDHIVLASTDYLPGHSEELVIKTNIAANNKSTLTLQTPVRFPHNGKAYSLSGLPAGVGPDPLPGSPAQVETRAAVGLLTRSIQIVSGGDTLGKDFPDENDPSHYYFGAHTVFRQGFKSLQIQGVGFVQMGQGGRIMHYPVHFHMVRTAPAGTFIKDSTINESMTRWVTIHATQGVLLARNVGFRSIGHGFYLEDGTETDNQIYANLGVSARAAVDTCANPSDCTDPTKKNSMQNPRKVPGILGTAHQHIGDKPTDAQEVVPYYTDIDHPSVFWIMNGWNDFEYNQAVGAGSCGMCYWLVPGANSGPSRYEHWSSYASAQSDLTQAGKTPLQKFYANACSSSMNSFITVGNTAPCGGVVNNADVGAPVLPPVVNPLAPNPNTDPTDADNYYPQIDALKGRQATQCPSGDGDCSAASVPRCDYGGGQEKYCMITNLDHYTSSFTWAETNVSALWLRPQWYLLSNSAITDVQNGGVTFVSGGGYSHSDSMPGYWALAHKNVFIGTTDGSNPFGTNAGPFTQTTKGTYGLSCDLRIDNMQQNAAFCLNAAQGISMPLDNFAANQRFFNIYDGPAYQDSNAYLDIKKTDLTDCKPNLGVVCPNLGWMYGNVIGGVLQTADHNGCYLPNAAIGWKQPNAFYYPPAFHSQNLYFKNVDIRHFVIEPLFQPGTLKTCDSDHAQNCPVYRNTRYCAGSFDMFNDFTDIDRQTELTDDDGTLTGLQSMLVNPGPTISVNQDHYFGAPLASLKTRECSSDINTLPADPITNPSTALTSAYDYVTTVVYPDCGYKCPDLGGDDNAKRDYDHYWAQTCESGSCYGVPLYRQLLTPDDKGVQPFIRMAGQGIAQRSTLTVNHGTYYLDTSVSDKTQSGQGWRDHPVGDDYKTVFKYDPTVPNPGVHYMFWLFAKPTTRQTYQIYIKSKKFQADDEHVYQVRAHQGDAPVTFDKAGSWPATWTKSYANNILTVTVDMRGTYDLTHNLHCQPASYCSPDYTNNTCVATNPQDPEADYVCRNWAAKDIDCPDAGCYGFAFVLPDDFVADDSGATPPAPGCIYADDGDTYWHTRFTPAPSIPGRADDCTYSPSEVPQPSFCVRAKN